MSASDTVLMHTAAGGLSVLLVQWAKRQDVRVIGMIGSEAKVAITIGHSADHVVLYRRQDMRDAVLRLTDGEGVDYVIDGVGSAVLPASLAVTRPFGMVVSIGQASDVGDTQANVADLVAFRPVRSIALARPGTFRYMANPLNYRAGTRAALQRMFDGVRVPVGGTCALGDATAVHTVLEAGQTSGALPLRP